MKIPAALRLLPIAAILVLAVLAKADPLPEFESIVASCKAAYEARPLVEVRQEPTKAWIKIKFKPALIKYDVAKTDSLVSPFTAYIEIFDIYVLARAADEDAAKVLEPEFGVRQNNNLERINFAYQSGKWELTGGKLTFSSGPRSEYPTVVPQTSDGIRKELSKFPACWKP